MNGINYNEFRYDEAYLYKALVGAPENARNTGFAQRQILLAPPNAGFENLLGQIREGQIYNEM